MNKINTVLGPINPESLGLTLVHEHITVGYPGWECDPLSKPYDREQIVKICLETLKPAKDCGVGSIIDATPMDLTRDIDIMKEVSEKLQINIICTTGRYTDKQGKWSYLKFRSLIANNMRQELYEGFMQEIIVGIGQTGIKPGVIKAATGYNAIASSEDAVLRAAAKASRETGIPVITHTESGTMGAQQADILLEEGAEPRRIMIGHMCGNPSLAYHMDVLSRDVSIAFDRFGLDVFVPDEVRIATLLELLKKGYADRVMLSQDAVAYTYGRNNIFSLLPANDQEKFKNWNHTNLFYRIIPALKEAGVSDEQIKTMTVDNPRRLLSGAGKEGGI